MSLQIIQIHSEDFDDFSHKVKGFDLDFRTMGRNRPIEALSRESIKIYQSIATTHIVYMESSLRLNQHVIAPKGLRTIAILPPKHPPLYWCGQPVIGEQFLLFPSDGEMTSISNSGFEVITVSFPNSWLDEACSTQRIHDGRGKVLSSSSFKLTKHWYQLNAWLNHTNSSNYDPLIFNDAKQSHFARQIVNSLFSDYSHGRQSARLRHQILLLNKAIAIIKSKKYRIQLKQLCHKLGTTERSLERLFKTYLGLTPKEYLTRYLMSEMNHLFAYHGKNLTVSQVAWQFGFNHLGQFSSDYKRIIGENPSRSLQRQFDCHAANCDCR